MAHRGSGATRTGSGVVVSPAAWDLGPCCWWGVANARVSRSPRGPVNRHLKGQSHGLDLSPRAARSTQERNREDPRLGNQRAVRARRDDADDQRGRRQASTGEAGGDRPSGEQTGSGGHPSPRGGGRPLAGRARGRRLQQHRQRSAKARENRLNRRGPMKILKLPRSDYGMVFVLLLLCAFFSVMTRAENNTRRAWRRRGNWRGPSRRGSTRRPARSSSSARATRTPRSPTNWSGSFTFKKSAWPGRCGRPADAAPRNSYQPRRAGLGSDPGVFACNQVTSSWSVYDSARERFPALAEAKVMKPESYVWPNFLKTDNLLNIANQIAVIAIIAIGMTMVIITGGIDLSVGSLIALSAVVTARLVRDAAGGEKASVLGMVLAGLGGILASAGSGVISGLFVTLCRIPPFIVTLAMMLVASGLAYILADGQSIHQVPDTFVRLGRGADLLHVPNAVVLMLSLYALAHVLMTRTVFGRYIYAVGGNAEAARLSGVPVRGVLLRVYTLCGALAGLGGVVMASQLKSGAPTYGQMYELYIIAAVVVGGTSLAGGEGKVLGTLIGAFIIAVIQNGMNLTGVESYTQKIVLGLVILGAVLLDRRKRGRTP